MTPETDNTSFLVVVLGPVAITAILAAIGLWLRSRNRRKGND